MRLINSNFWREFLFCFWCFLGVKNSKLIIYSLIFPIATLMAKLQFNLLLFSGLKIEIHAKTHEETQVDLLFFFVSVWRNKSPRHYWLINSKALSKYIQAYIYFDAKMGGVNLVKMGAWLCVNCCRLCFSFTFPGFNTLFIFESNGVKKIVDDEKNVCFCLCVKICSNIVEYRFVLFFRKKTNERQSIFLGILEVFYTRISW